MYTVVGLLLEVAMNNYSNAVYINDAKRALIRYFENINKLCLDDEGVELTNSYIAMVKAGVSPLYNFKVIEAGLSSITMTDHDTLLFYTCDESYNIGRLQCTLPMLLCKDSTDLALVSYCVSYHMWLRYKHDFDLKYLDTYAGSYNYGSCSFVNVCAMMASRVVSFILSGRFDTEPSRLRRSIMIPLRDLLDAAMSEYLDK